MERSLVHLPHMKGLNWFGGNRNPVSASRMEKAAPERIDGGAVYREFTRGRDGAYGRYFRESVEAGDYEGAEAEARKLADAVKAARPSGAASLADALEQVAALDPEFQGRPLRAMAERLRA